MALRPNKSLRSYLKTVKTTRQGGFLYNLHIDARQTLLNESSMYQKQTRPRRGRAKQGDVSEPALAQILRRYHPASADIALLPVTFTQ